MLIHPSTKRFKLHGNPDACPLFVQKNERRTYCRETILKVVQGRKAYKTLVETAGAFYMLQAFMQGNCL